MNQFRLSQSAVFRRLLLASAMGSALASPAFADVCEQIRGCNEMRRTVLDAAHVGTINNLINQTWELSRSVENNETGNIIIEPRGAFTVVNHGDATYTVSLSNPDALVQMVYGSRTILPITVYVGDSAVTNGSAQSTCTLTVSFSTNAGDRVNPQNIPDVETHVVITPSDRARLVRADASGLVIERLPGHEEDEVSVALDVPSLSLPPASLEVCPRRAPAPEAAPQAVPAEPAAPAPAPEAAPAAPVAPAPAAPAPRPIASNPPAAQPRPVPTAQLPEVAGPNVIAAARDRVLNAANLGVGAGLNDSSFVPLRLTGRGIIQSGAVRGSVFEGSVDLGVSMYSLHIQGRTEFFPVRLTRRNFRNGTFEVVVTPLAGRAELDLNQIGSRGHLVLNPQVAAALGFQAGNFHGAFRARIAADVGVAADRDGAGGMIGVQPGFDAVLSYQITPRDEAHLAIAGTLGLDFIGRVNGYINGFSFDSRAGYTRTLANDSPLGPRMVSVDLIGRATNQDVIGSPNSDRTLPGGGYINATITLDQRPQAVSAGASAR